MPVLDSAFHPAAMRGFAASAKRRGQWRPGLRENVRHSDIFASARDGAGAGLALALAREQSGADDAARPWLWVQDKTARRLTGLPYGPGLPESLRHRLIHVAADSAEDALFALEEGLRCHDLAFVLGELAGNPKALNLTTSRRLSLAAEKHGVPLWLVRLDARRDLGSARLRWEAGSAPSSRPQWNPHAPGPPSWRAELFRAHTYQPGFWILRDDASLAAEPAAAPHPGDLVRPAGARPLAAG